MQTYFREPHPGLARELDAHQRRLADGCPSTIRPLVTALVLGGGYGRGEGGVLQTGEEARLFNDLDYFLFSPRPADSGLLGWVREWERTETSRLGIDVECVVLDDRILSRPTLNMMFSDLAFGHRVTIGSPDVLADWKDRLNPRDIPLGEATRLLWNRGTGLYLCGVELKTGHPDRAFIQRNHAKLKLALGDAILCRNGQYCAFAAERAERLRKLQDPLLSETLRKWHAEGVAFKFNPRIDEGQGERLPDTQSQLAREWSRVFLGIESERLLKNRTFGTLEDYAGFRGKIFPDSSSLRNILLSARDRLKRGGGLRPVWDYPRGGLYRALADMIACQLAQEPAAGTPRWIGGAQPGQPAEAYREIYLKWWHHYS